MSWDKPVTYEMTPSSAVHINKTLSNGFFTPVTGVENEEGIRAWEPLEKSVSTGYLPELNTAKGRKLLGKYINDALTGKLSSKQVDALPERYSQAIKNKLGTIELAGDITRGQNAFANKAFQWGITTMPLIAGLGPAASLVSNVGWVPAAGILTAGTATGLAGSYGLSEGLGWIGRQIDNKNREDGKWSNYESAGRFVGGIAGGIGGGALGGYGAQRGMYRWANSKPINNQKIFTDSFVDDAASYYQQKRLKSLADWKVRMAKDIPNRTDEVLNLVDDYHLTYNQNDFLPKSAFTPRENPLENLNISRHNYAQEVANNARINKKVMAALGRKPSYPVSGNTNELYKVLSNEGVDPSLLTESNLHKLSSARAEDYFNASVLPEHYSYRTTSPSNPIFHGYDMMRGKNRVGYINVVDTRNLINPSEIDGVAVNMVKNTSNIAGKTPVKGVSEQGYNAVVGDLGELRTGRNYMSAEKTTAVVSKFPKKRYLGNTGDHFYNTTGKLVKGPVYDLLSPTYYEPVKYLDLFGLEGLDNTGHFTVDFTKGPMYKKGGKLLNK